MILLVLQHAARNKETLEWAQNDVFGKVKQTSKSITINDQKISTSISEKMDYLVPAAKIADMATGWLAGQAARDFTPTDMKALDGINIEESEEFKTTKYFCKRDFRILIVPCKTTTYKSRFFTRNKRETELPKNVSSLFLRCKGKKFHRHKQKFVREKYLIEDILQKARD